MTLSKVLGLQLRHPSFNEYSGLISFRIDWLDLLAVQGILKSFLQHHSSKALRESFPRQVDRESRGSQGLSSSRMQISLEDYARSGPAVLGQR